LSAPPLWFTLQGMAVFGKEWKPREEVLVADGAWGTEFLTLGLSPGDAPEGWNLSRLREVRGIAERYLAAGAQIVLTNTFGGNRFQLERHGLADRVREINRIGAELTAQAVQAAGALRTRASGAGSPGSAEAAAGSSGSSGSSGFGGFADSADSAGFAGAITAGDIGPSGKLLFMEEVGREELFEAFAEQARALKEGGAQWLVVETMTDRDEMELAVRAAAATGLPVVASMTYEKGPAGYRTMMGHSPEDCVAAAEAAGASLIGANCGAGVDTYVELAAILRKLTTRPLWIKANAGLPELVDGVTRYRMSARVYASHIPALLEAGVDVVGGCCGTTPEFVEKIRAIVDRWNAGKK